MNEINVEAIVDQIQQMPASCSLAERFIDTIKPYGLNDIQAASLFRKVKQQLLNRHPQARPAAVGCWALPAC